MNYFSSATTDLLPGFFQSVAPFLDNYGYLAVGLLLFLQNIGIPFLPAWLTLMAATVYASFGMLNVTILLIVATLAIIIGGNIGFIIGEYGGEPLLVKYGKFFGLTPKYLEKFHKFYNRYGIGVVLFGFFSGYVRQFNGIIAGTAEMKWRWFVICHALGATLWVSVWVAIAYQAGSHVEAIYRAFLRYEFYLIVVIFLAIIIFSTIKIVKEKK